jgi:hypothetical protein
MVKKSARLEQPDGVIFRHEEVRGERLAKIFQTSTTLYHHYTPHCLGMKQGV